jgi:hypothetical protein
MKQDEAIVIITDEERFTFKLGKSKIYYRRLSPLRARVLREQNTKNGEVDMDILGRQGLEYCVTGWSDVCDATCKEVQFSPDKLDMLPGKVRQALTIRIIDGDQLQELETQLPN